MSSQLISVAKVKSYTRLALTGIAVPALVVIGAQGGGTYNRLAGISTSSANGARPADVAAMKAVVSRVDSLFRRNTVLAPPPSDVLIQPFGAVGHTTAGTQPALPAGYNIFLLRPKQYCDKTGTCRMDPGEGPSMKVQVNNPIAVMGLWGGSVRPIGRSGSLATMYAGKRQVGEMSGFPLYENGAVVIAKRGEDVWLPVTRQEFARAHIEELRATQGNYMQDLIAREEQELATLDDGGGPAYCCRENRAHPIGVTDASTENAYPIVRLNPAYFDTKANPAAVQLIVVGTEQAYAKEMGVKPTEPNYQLMKAIREQLDWAALAAMVH